MTVHGAPSVQAKSTRPATMVPSSNLTITGISRKISVPGSSATSGRLHLPPPLLRSISAGTGGECSASRTGTSLFAAKTRPWSDDGSVPFDLRVIADGTERILQKVRPLPINSGKCGFTPRRRANSRPDPLELETRDQRSRPTTIRILRVRRQVSGAKDAEPAGVDGAATRAFHRCVLRICCKCRRSCRRRS
jgi:hypothetical protein